MDTTAQTTRPPHLTMDLSFPSELGYEKIARDTIAAFARRLGFDQDRIEDLKTAIGEACINAIEHGNERAPGLRVDISCSSEDGRLTIDIRDRGLKRYEDRGPLPSIEHKLSGMAPLRGMGLMMIAQLVDEAGFTESQEGGNHFRLALYYQKRDSQTV